MDNSNEKQSDLGKLRSEASSLLRKAFSFSREEFSDLIPWSDGAGISRIRKFPGGYASLYKIGIFDRELENQDVKKRLSVSVSYGKETHGGISLGSDQWDLSRPIDLDTNDEFSFDSTTGKFFHKKREVTPEEIFNYLEDKHMRPTKVVAGLYLRARLFFWRLLLPFVIRILDFILIAILLIISGERVKEPIFNRLFGLHKENANERIPEEVFKDPKTVDFFGYKAKRWSVVFYCLLHLTLFAYFFTYQIRNPLIELIFANNFLSLCYIVVSFAITEALVPMLLRSIIEKITPKLFGDISFKKLKI